jgi:hypothetical protein
MKRRKKKRVSNFLRKFSRPAMSLDTFEYGVDALLELGRDLARRNQVLDGYGKPLLDRNHNDIWGG